MITIILPVYDAEHTLSRCLDSLLSQTFSNFEIIVVNDGSTDSSSSILHKYCEADSRVAVINKPNGGVSSARNTALEIAKGEWIAFCDSDDYVEVNWLSDFIVAAKTHDDIVFQGIRYIGEGNVWNKKVEDYSGDRFRWDNPSLIKQSLTYI